jgi:hypothetical protein
MEIAYAFFANAAQLALDGTFSVFGAALEIVRSPAFPCMTNLSLLIKLTGVPDGEPDQTFEMDVTGPDGLSILPVPISTPLARFVVPTHNSVVHRGNKTLIVGFGGFVLPAPGDYTFSFRIIGPTVAAKTLQLTAEQIHV